MSETFTLQVLSGQGPRRTRPVRVRNPRRFGETMLVLPPALRKRAIRKRDRKPMRPHARPRYFRGRRLAGVALFAAPERWDLDATGAGDGGDEISIDAFALQAEGPAGDVGDLELRATLEAIVYVTDEPVTAQQIAQALELPTAKVTELLEKLAAEYGEAHHGVSIRNVAGGYKMATKPECHEGVRRFVRAQKPPLKLSMAALETLAMVAYKQPITSPEILEIRGVQGAGVLKTLLDKKLITTAGRKNVVGRPMMYKTTREFLIQFGLNSVSELPTLKEFEELKNLAFSEAEEIEKAEVGQPRYEKYAEHAAALDAYAESASGESQEGEATEQPAGDGADEQAGRSEGADGSHTDGSEGEATKG
ncbi:MAG: SMC-Scp complex subunit ScpB [Bryobacterales bacterium]|nr:SMC-Scp complex subunit ScpB [Bryobacterales bacterium]